MKLTVLLALTTMKWIAGVALSSMSYGEVNWAKGVDYDGVDYDVLG